MPYLLVLIFALVIGALPAQAGFPRGGGGSSFAGPCDVAGGCAVAFSIDGAMADSYHGPLFQLALVSNHATTLDVGQASNRMTDMTTWSTFCGGDPSNCLVSKIYNHIVPGVNDFVPVTVVGNFGPDCRVSSFGTLACAATFAINGVTGLPEIYVGTGASGGSVPAPEYDIGGSDVPATGVTSGAGPWTVMVNETGDNTPVCCTSFGKSHIYSLGIGDPGYFGGLIEISSFYGIYMGLYGCSTDTTYCAGESFEEGGGCCTWTNPTGVQIPQDFAIPLTMVYSWDGSTTLDISINGDVISTNLLAGSIIPGNYLRLGGGGDLSNPATMHWREGFITNGHITPTVIAAVVANAAARFPTLAFLNPALPSPPAVTSADTASGTVGVPFSYSITATNSPTSYGASGLPSWASVDTSTGAITGTPDAAATTSVTISATNTGGTGSGPLSITIASAPPPAPVITSATTASATAGVPFSYTITATNSPTSYGATVLPSNGLSLNSSTGVISGTPSSATTLNLTISATNAGGTGTGPLTITVASGTSAPVITSSGSTVGTAGNFMVYQITATNSPTSYSASGLPSGLSVNTTDGVISGTPTGAGSSTPTIGATNAGGTGNATPTFSIAAAGVPGPLTVASNSRLFATPNGQAIYLTGDHTWTSGISFATPGPFSFTAMIDYMSTINVNFVRHWDDPAAPVNPPYGNVTTPLPFNRSGTCCASDGGNKFDLTSFNQPFFDALKSDVEYAASKGMYIMPMLINPGDYDQTGFTFWATEYWNGVNNINGTTTSYDVFTQSPDSTTLAIQQAYFRKYLDTLANEPNVVYEVANELFFATGNISGVDNWQEGIANYVHSYEASQGYSHHLVGIEYLVSDSRISSSPADFLMPTISSSPVPVFSYGKPSIIDTDHWWGIGGGTSWWWTGFANGGLMISMDDMEFTGLTGNLSLAGNPTWSSSIPAMLANRPALTQTRALAVMVDMSGMVPNGSLSSTGLALADTTKHMYIVYADSGGTITVNLSSDSGIALRTRWLNTADGSISSITNITGGSSSQSSTSPFGGNPATLIVTP